MKLNPNPFALIQKGIKTIEVRLYDEKRQQIKVGDKIIFWKLPELTEKLTVEVVEILTYPDFKSLYAAFPAADFGAAGWSVPELVANMYQYYSRAEEGKYGVVGLKIMLI